MTLLNKLRGIYQIKVICSNCKTRSFIDVKKGTTQDEVLSDPNIVCEYCGCDTLDIEKDQKVKYVR